MREYFCYWRIVLLRSWKRTWSAIIERSFGAIIRDFAILLVAGYAIFELKGVLSKIQAPVDVIASEWETGLWALASVAGLIGIFLLCFLCQLLFIEPFLLWKDEQTKAQRHLEQATAYAADEEKLALRRRELEAQEAHTAAIREQVAQQRRDSDPIIRSLRDSKRRAEERLKNPVPDWPIRDAFFELEPNVFDEEKRLKVGRHLLDLLATGQIHSWGRRRSFMMAPSVLEAIKVEFWNGANWTYDFFAENREPQSAVDAYETVSLGNSRTEYQDVRFNCYELKTVWARQSGR